MFLTHNLEKCDSCGRVVHIEEQYRGVCKRCCEIGHLMACSLCGEVFHESELPEDRDYACSECQKTQGPWTTSAEEEKKLERAFASARKTYARLHGKIVQVDKINGYRETDCEEVLFDVPLLVRILKTPDDCIARDMADHVDPIYDVEPLDARPEITGMRSFWIYGVSIEIETGLESPGDIVSEEIPNDRIQDALKVLVWTKETRAYLRKNDPKALEQADMALKMMGAVPACGWESLDQ